MTALETRFDTILPTLATKADVGALRADMEKIDLRLNARIDELRADMLSMRAEMRYELQKTNADIKTWALATMIAIIGTVLAGFIGISQFYRNAPPPPPAKAPINFTVPSA
ncbi:MAG: hypothetical protein ABWY27_03225 [Telluria sp.]